MRLVMSSSTKARDGIWMQCTMFNVYHTTNRLLSVHRSVDACPGRALTYMPLTRSGRVLHAGPAAAPCPHPPHLAADTSEPLQRQVFISHTGQDEDAKTFAVDILKPKLEAAGLNTFIDFRDLEMGCEWPQELVEAATNSMVVVAVLSRSYTNRFWCMLELDLALQSRQQRGEHGMRGPLVIPVFYDAPDAIVDPEAIKKRWSEDVEPHLKSVEDLGPEWAWRVDASRWAGNITAMKGVLQNLRRKLESADKDEQTQLAERVVSEAVKHMPQVLDMGCRVVGFKEQADFLAGRVEKTLGLWLYGHGAYFCFCPPRSIPPASCMFGATHWTRQSVGTLHLSCSAVSAMVAATSGSQCVVGGTACPVFIVLRHTFALRTNDHLAQKS
jgi:hypothetical protein